MNINNECPICLIEIETNDSFLLLNCCKKKAHLLCLENWYKNNISRNCFLCTQSNVEINNLFPINNPSNENLNNNIVNIPTNNIINENYNNNNNNDIIIYRSRYNSPRENLNNLCMTLGIIIIVGTILITISILI